MKTIGHERKKKFKAMVFSLALDFKAGHLRPRSIARVKRFIELYSGIDHDFVQRTITTYEKKLDVSIKEALGE
ncbi:MAG: hypothetical protein FWH03_05470 [Firmicutes bacterium]|nr:hypothetical protein [Bacillota bacterium]